jgi:hypothetical protein
MLILLNVGLAVIRGIFYVIWSLGGSKNIFNKLNKSVIYSNMKFFDTNSIGRIINRLS